jgi:hypothetical protein
MSFAISISLLGLVQAALVALPGRLPALDLTGLRSRWWALLPAGSIVVVIGVIDLYEDSATALSYLALVAVPPLAAFALARLVRGARSAWAAAAVALFAIAWAGEGSLSGDVAATALSGLACVTLGWLLVLVVPERLLRLGVYAMAFVDACLVSADLLQAPNSVLTTAAPVSNLPSLQAVHLGDARMGFGDLFVAALVGCMLAAPAARGRGGERGDLQLLAATLVAVLALCFDLLFFAVDELPATVPVAVALALARRWTALRDGSGAAGAQL